MRLTKKQLQYKLAGMDRHDYDAIMETFYELGAVAQPTSVERESELRARLNEAKLWRHISIHDEHSYFAIEGDKRIAYLDAQIAVAQAVIPRRRGR